MDFSIPEFVKPFLWSYDIDKLKKDEDKRRIITNVLNLGTKKATDWIFRTFNRNDIKDAIERPFPGEWNNQSLNFWSLILDVKPQNTRRLISN